jgi:hypothetical protein
VALELLVAIAAVEVEVAATVGVEAVELGTVATGCQLIPNLRREAVLAVS